jgi:hypothetical protein
VFERGEDFRLTDASADLTLLAQILHLQGYDLGIKGSDDVFLKRVNILYDINGPLHRLHPSLAPLQTIAILWRHALESAVLGRLDASLRPLQRILKRSWRNSTIRVPKDRGRSHWEVRRLDHAHIEVIPQLWSKEIWTPAPPGAPSFTSPVHLAAHLPALIKVDAASLTELDVLRARFLGVVSSSVGSDDAERLLSFMTVPTLCLPLLLAWLVDHDRWRLCVHRWSRELLVAAVFETGAWLAPDEPVDDDVGGMVPLLVQQRRSIHRHAHFALWTSLQRAPGGVIEPLQAIGRGVEERFKTAKFHRRSSTVLLFIARLLADVASFIEADANETSKTRLRLGSYLVEIRVLLDIFGAIIEQWRDAAFIFIFIYSFNKG